MGCTAYSLLCIQVKEQNHNVTVKYLKPDQPVLLYYKAVFKKNGCSTFHMHQRRAVGSDCCGLKVEIHCRLSATTGDSAWLQVSVHMDNQDKKCLYKYHWLRTIFDIH